MTRGAKISVLAIAALSSLVAAAAFLFGTRFSTMYRLDVALRQLQYDGRTVLVSGKRTTDPQSVFGCNTFESDLANADLVAIFDSAAAALQAKFHQDPQYLIKTDEEGWDRLCAVWDLPDGHAEVMTGSANDNNYTCVVVGPPDPSMKGRPSSRAAMGSIYER